MPYTICIGAEHRSESFGRLWTEILQPSLPFGAYRSRHTTKCFRRERSLLEDDNTIFQPVHYDQCNVDGVCELDRLALTLAEWTCLTDSAHRAARRWLCNRPTKEKMLDCKETDKQSSPIGPSKKKGRYRLSRRAACLYPIWTGISWCWAVSGILPLHFVERGCYSGLPGGTDILIEIEEKVLCIHGIPYCGFDIASILGQHEVICSVGGCSIW